MISLRTFADASIRLAISESSLSLSADQLTPINMEQTLSTRRHLGSIEETLLIIWFSPLLCSTNEHRLAKCSARTKLFPAVDWFYPAEAVKDRRTFLRTDTPIAMRPYSEVFRALDIQVPRYCGFRSGKLVCNLYSTRPPAGAGPLGRIGTCSSHQTQIQERGSPDTGRQG